MTFAEFYAAYRTEHRHPANRGLHLAAKLASAAALGVAVARASGLALLAAPLLAVLPCWLGHWVFERNQPTAFFRPAGSILGRLTRPGQAEPDGPRPYYSLLADLVMCREMLAGWWRSGTSRART